MLKQVSTSASFINEIQMNYSRRIWTILVIAAVFSISVAAIYFHNLGASRSVRSIAPADDFHLAPDELARFTNLAEGGDSSACRRLYFYYAFACANMERGEYWLELACKSGDKNSCEDLTKIRRSKLRSDGNNAD